MKEDFITKEILMEIIKKAPFYISSIPEQFRTYELYSMMARVNCDYFKMVPINMRDFKLCVLIVKKDYLLLCYLILHLKNIF